MRILRILVAIILLVWAGRLGEAAAATLTTLHSFTGGYDGSQPYGGLVQGSDGNFYGTTRGGGVSGFGTVFKIGPAGAFATLHNFTGSADGANPEAGLVEGSDGNFYGTTYAGGASGSGTVFKISATGTLTTLRSFSGANGANPVAGLVEGSDGSFYGTTYAGGASGSGTVFKISATGTLTTLRSFSGANGAYPVAGLVEGSDSNFFGTTYGGGASGAGTVFKISATGTLTTLRSFSGANGAYPVAGLVEGSDSNFFGTTYGGGASGSGTVFKISTTGTLKSLYSFSGGADGGNPTAGLIQGSDGNFYGTTYAGGASGSGTVFKISATGALTTLHSFTGGTDGGGPLAGLVQGSVTNLFGTTSAGGITNVGTVFDLLLPCTYSLSPTHVALPGLADTGTFTVTASSTGCVWTATNSVDWITITSSNSGVGSGTVAYSVTANANSNSRVGTIIAAGKTFTVTQQGQVFGEFLPGTYNGLVIQTNAPTRESSGSIRLVLGNTGSFAANLTMGGMRSAFKGRFDTSGNATNTVALGKTNSLHVILHAMAATNGTDQIAGTVSNGTFTSELLTDLAIFSSANPCPCTGTFTFVLAPVDSSDPNLPPGYGYGTLTVTSAGSGRMQGVLGDGTKISAQVPVSGYGTLPFYNSLYKNQGSCIGWVAFGTNGTLDATLDWFRPSMLVSSYYLSLLGSKYVVPAAGEPMLDLTNTTGNALLTLGDGNLTGVLSNLVTVATNNTVTILSGNVTNLTFKLTPKTGLFSGGFRHPVTGKTTKFQGAVLQLQDFGAGYFLGTNQSGYVILEPTP